jgi:hypothetical protein
VQCAQKCNLVHLVDKRFKGVASGVGHAAIYGRVHMATLRFGRKAAVDIAIMVMDMKGGPELLLGLDVMRKCARALLPFPPLSLELLFSAHAAAGTKRRSTSGATCCSSAARQCHSLKATIADGDAPSILVLLHSSCCPACVLRWRCGIRVPAACCRSLTAVGYML